MKKKIGIACVGVVLVVLALVFSGEKGTPPVLSFDGTEITIGESSPYNMTSAGFESSEYLIGELPARSWLSGLIGMQNANGESCAYIYLYNPEKEAVSYLGATIYKIDIYMKSEEHSYWAEKNALVNGIDFRGMNADEVKEAMKEYKLARETDAGDLRFEDGSYKYFFTFDKATGILDEISVELTIAKDY
ncbi:MAG: hypothetical protein NC337_08770 [Roseburia sp.]|nr:hypothetical protein [Roseburia sp.]